MIKIIKYIFTNYLIKYIFYILLTILPLVITLQIPYLSINYINEFIEKKNSQNFYLILITLIVIFIFRLISQSTSQYLSILLKNSTISKFRIEIFKDCLYAKMLKFETRNPGYLAERIMNDTNSIIEYSLSFVNEIFSIIITLSISFYMVYKIDQRFLIAILIIFIIYYINYKFIIDKTIIQDTRKRDLSATISGFLVDRFSGIQTIKLFNAENNSICELEQLFVSFFEVEKKIFKIENLQRLPNIIVKIVAIIIFISAFNFSSKSKKITAGEIFAVISYSTMIIGPIMSIMVLLKRKKIFDSCLQRIQEINNIEKENQKSLNNITAFIDPENRTLLEVKNLSFKYSTHKQLLNTVSFKIFKNEIVGIIGENGSGKSTLAKLIVRLFDIESGEVFLN